MKLSGAFVPLTFITHHLKRVTSDKQAEFLALLEPVYDRLWRFSLGLARDSDDAKDLMSETILATYERFHTIRDTRAFTSFLFTVATRIQRQKVRRAGWFGAYDSQEAEQWEATGPSPEEAADISILRDAIETLPQKQREAVMLFELSGFSLEEIRDIQGGTLSGVKSRLRRGRQELARRLGVECNENERISLETEERPANHFNKLFLARSV